MTKAEVRWEALPVGTYRAQLGHWRVQVRALRFGASDTWGPWAVDVNGQHVTVRPTLEEAQTVALRLVPAGVGELEVSEALRTLACALVRRHAEETDFDERRALRATWASLRNLADELGQDWAVPFEMEDFKP